MKLLTAQEARDTAEKIVAMNEDNEIYDLLYVLNEIEHKSSSGEFYLSIPVMDENEELITNQFDQRFSLHGVIEQLKLLGYEANVKNVFLCVGWK